MPFANAIRLPFFLTRPAWPAESNVFRRADGSLKVLSAVIRKTFDGETDYMPAAWHEKLRIALMHDNVSIAGQKLVGAVALEGDGYEVGWERFQDYPIAKAEFKIQVGDYDFSNDNCQTCEEANQLSLTDDNFGEYAEGDPGSGNVFTNDSIFCSPVVASITTYNTLFLTGAPTIDNAGNVTWQLKTPLPTVTGVNLFTYRVTCPNGGYDEADVYIDVDGSLAGCSAPENVRPAVEITETFADITWDENGSPADGYYWELFKASNLGAVVVSSTSPLGFPRAQMTGLDPCTEYVLFVRAVCEAGVTESVFTQYNFTTACPEQGCGNYEIEYDNGMPEGGPQDRGFADVFYLDCASVQRIIRIFNQQPRFICALENSPGNPVQIINATTVTYVGAC